MDPLTSRGGSERRREMGEQNIYKKRERDRQVRNIERKIERTGLRRRKGRDTRRREEVTVRAR